MSSLSAARYSWWSLLPNGLTITRLLAGLMFPFWGPGVRLALLVYAGISDLIDGEIGRRTGGTTEFGRRMDPVADKTVVLAVVGTMLWEGSVPWWALLLVAMRDIVVVLTSICVAFQRLDCPMQTSPLVIGKIATGAQFAFLFAVLLLPNAYGPVFVVAAVISCAAAIAYLYDAYWQMKNLAVVNS